MHAMIDCNEFIFSLIYVQKDNIEPEKRLFTLSTALHIEEKTFSEPEVFPNQSVPRSSVYHMIF